MVWNGADLIISAGYFQMILHTNIFSATLQTGLNGAFTVTIFQILMKNLPVLHIAALRHSLSLPVCDILVST